MTLRGQTLFYADAVNFLRRIFSPCTYVFRDDFVGDLIIYRNDDIIYVCEIKSERECFNISTTQEEAFKDIRNKINSLKCFNSHGAGKYKGLLAFLAQPWWYLREKIPNDLLQLEFDNKKVILVIPFNRDLNLNTVQYLEEALKRVTSC